MTSNTSMPATSKFRRAEGWARRELSRMLTAFLLLEGRNWDCARDFKGVDGAGDSHDARLLRRVYKRRGGIFAWLHENLCGISFGNPGSFGRPERAARSVRRPSSPNRLRVRSQPDGRNDGRRSARRGIERRVVLRDFGSELVSEGLGPKGSRSPAGWMCL